MPITQKQLAFGVMFWLSLPSFTYAQPTAISQDLLSRTIGVAGHPYQAEVTATWKQNFPGNLIFKREVSGTAARDNLGNYREQGSLISDGGPSRQSFPVIVNLFESQNHIESTWNTGSPRVLTVKFYPDPPSLFESMIIPRPFQMLQNSIETGNWSTNSIIKDLGMQKIDGRNTKGIRAVTTIPARAMGNNLPIIIYRDVWTDMNLGIVVRLRVSDPIVGELEVELSHVMTGNQDESQFKAPLGRQARPMTPPLGVPPQPVKPN